MVARVTLAEIDVVRMGVAEAVQRFRETVLPELHGEPGYEGGYVLATPEGKALVITFWRSRQDAQAGLASGFYAAQVQKFATLYRATPGRELYDVQIAQPPGSPDAAEPVPASAPGSPG